MRARERVGVRRLGVAIEGKADLHACNTGLWVHVSANGIGSCEMYVSATWVWVKLSTTCVWVHWAAQGRERV